MWMNDVYLWRFMYISKNLFGVWNPNRADGKTEQRVSITGD